MCLLGPAHEEDTPVVGSGASRAAASSWSGRTARSYRPEQSLEGSPFIHLPAEFRRQPLTENAPLQAEPGGTGPPSLLANRRFSLWLGSQTACNLGYSAWVISVLWLAYQISGTLLLSALVLFVQYGIYSLTSIAGPFADRTRNKRSVFLIVLPLQAITATLVGIFATSGLLSEAVLLSAVAVMSLLDDFWWTTSNTVPRILVGRDNLLRASGIQTAFFGAGSLAGYAAGAALLIFFGAAGGAFLRAAMLTLSAALLIPVAIPTAPTRVRRLLGSFAEGWSLLWKESGRSLLKIGSLFAAWGFFVGAPALLITLFANREYGSSSLDYGLLFTAYMVGVIASGIAVHRTNPRRYIGTFLVLAMIAQGATIALAVVTLPMLVPSAAVWFLVGLASGVPSTLVYAYLQAVAPPEAVGRIVSDLELFPSATGAIGAVVLGVLATVISPTALGLYLGLVLVVVGACALGVPEVRRMRF